MTWTRRPCSVSLCARTRASCWPPVLSSEGHAESQAPSLSLDTAPPCWPRPGPGLRPVHWVGAGCPWPLPHREPPVVTAQGCTAQSHPTVCVNSVSRPVTCTAQSLQASCACPGPGLASSCGPQNNSDRKPCWCSDRGDKEGGGMHPMECAP